MRRMLSSIIMLAAMLALAIPVFAGGWATVRLDEPPADLRPGQPWRFGFMVLQHDVTPNSDVTPVVRAIHLETGDDVTATAVQEGQTGHFVAELTLPLSGEWSWTITPEPFAETAFPALMVSGQQAGDASAGLASLRAGSCTSPGALTQALDVPEVRPMALSEPSPLVVSEAMLNLPLRELTDAPHAILIGDTAQGAPPAACGEITGNPDGDELAIPLQPLGTSDIAGLAIMRPDASRTTVALYLFTLDRPGDEAATNGPTETVTMSQDWLFQPASLEVVPGTTVTWVNRSTIVHAVTLDDPGRTASGLIEPGQTFSVTFDTPGSFRYRCSPHPGMEGTITVTG